MEATTSSPLLTEGDVSKRLNVSLAALRRWRVERRGPTYHKLGALVRYRPEEVDRWLRSCSTEQQNGWGMPAADPHQPAPTLERGD